MTDSPKGLLDGITVIDLTRVLAGPYCTMMLADMGARVIKIENPKGGDDARHIGPFVIEGVSAYFSSINRGKQSIALNLKLEQHKEALLKMLAKADVLVENFRPGTMDKLGLTDAFLKENFPHLVVASASGFGQTGPYSRKPAYDMVVQAMGGIMSVTGHPGNPPTRVGSSIGDIVAGIFTATGISAALYRRAQTGLGERIDVSMLDSQVAILENAIARYVGKGEVPGPIGARHPSITPFQAYETKDGHMVIAAGNDHLFRELCNELELGDLLADPRFASNDARCDHHDELKQMIEAALAAKTSADWIAQLEAAGLPCGPINRIDQVLSDPQVVARNMVISANDPDAGELRMAGNPIKVSGYPDPAQRAAAPRLDADRAALIDEFDLNLSD